MNNKTPFTITCSDDALCGLRLDKFLFLHFPDYSRSYFQQLIEVGNVHVNAAPSKPSYTIKKNDHVIIHFKAAAYAAVPMPIDFTVVDENEDFIVVSKPAGLVVHHSPTAPDQPNLVSGLLHRFKEIAACNDSIRPGIVHRLDKDTSGLLLVARHQVACLKLSAMFKQRQVSKTYLAIVNGQPPAKGSIDFPIGRNVNERHKMSVGGICAREALTHYQVLAYYPSSALLAVKIVTGRTHQIRVHCASIGHSIVGDKTYGTTSSHISRQALHAWQLSFVWKNKQYSYTNSLPGDMKALLQKLKDCS